MEWFLDNLRIIIFAAIIIVYVLKAVRGRSEAANENDPATRPSPGSGEDVEEAERTRQIQEEIRRRILARQRGEDPSGMPPPVIVEEREPVEVDTPEGGWGRHGPPPVPVPAAQPEPAAVPAYVIRDDAAILEAQRALEEQFRLVRRVREAASGGIPALPSSNAAFGTVTRPSVARAALQIGRAHV